MLLKKTILEAIVAGKVDRAFRRWKKLSVKPESTFKTAVGLIQITDVRKINGESIADSDAEKAGYTNRDNLLEELRKRDGDIYQIGLCYAGADPRIALREDFNLKDEDIECIQLKLKRLDDRSKCGPWTKRVLSIIQERPQTRAAILADELGYEKEWLKLNVRKLKNLGLTISHEPGYEISPRGNRFLRSIDTQNSR